MIQATDFFGKPLLAGDRVVFTHSSDSKLEKGVVEKVNKEMSVIRRVSWSCAKDEWLVDSGRWATTRCYNGNILKIE